VAVDPTDAVVRNTGSQNGDEIQATGPSTAAATAAPASVFRTILPTVRSSPSPLALGKQA
jgi:hypothetical protein